MYRAVYPFISLVLVAGACGGLQPHADTGGGTPGEDGDDGIDGGGESETMSSTSGDRQTTADDSPDGTDSGSDSVGGVKLDVGSGDTAGGDGLCGCGDNTDLIYVLSDQGELWTFDPQTENFARLGTFSCPAALLDTPFSMGVARNGIAWVMYRPSGDIFHVDVNDANACDDPGYDPGQNGFRLFGMAFVSQGPHSPCDDLYALTYNDTVWSEGPGAGQLGRLDNYVPTAIGAVDYNGGELTGTGDGRLFAFAGVDPAKLTEYDKVTGDELETIPLTNLELTQAFAFAFWGGDFYFFTEEDQTGGTVVVPAQHSKVTHMDYDGSRALTTIVEQAPLRIVGAAVSTCAPFIPPG
jgi:hypothetical protein